VSLFSIVRPCHRVKWAPPASVPPGCCGGWRGGRSAARLSLGKAPKLFEPQSCGITRGAHGEVFSFGVSNPLIAAFYFLFSIHPAIADGELLGIDGLSVEPHGLGACCGKPVVFALRGSDFRLAGGGLPGVR
jgi:hypothetical protein